MFHMKTCLNQNFENLILFYIFIIWRWTKWDFLRVFNLNFLKVVRKLIYGKFKVLSDELRLLINHWTLWQYYNINKYSKTTNTSKVKDFNNKIPKITGFMLKDLKNKKRKKERKMIWVYFWLFVQSCRVLLIDFCCLLWTSFENHEKSWSLLFCFLIMTWYKIYSPLFNFILLKDDVFSLFFFVF